LLPICGGAAAILGHMKGSNCWLFLPLWTEI